MKIKLVGLSTEKHVRAPWTTKMLLLFVLLASATLFSCQFETKEKTSLPDEKLARIMADISIADAATNGLNAFEKDSLMQVYFKQVYEIHGITLESYEQDLRILAKDLNHMQEVVKMADELLTEESKNLDNAPKK